MEAQSFIDNANALEGYNAIVLGVSRDSLASHQKFIEKLGITFVLLSDPDGQACQAYGVCSTKVTVINLPIVERSTFIIDEAGVIEKIYRKVQVKGHVESILAHLAGHN